MARKLGRWSHDLDAAILYHDEAAMKIVQSKMRTAARKLSESPR